MKKIYGLVLVIYGIFAISYGAYNQMMNNKTEKIEADVKIDESINKDSNDLRNNYDDVLSYLNNKYNLEFEVVREVSNYCLGISEYNLYYSMPCTDFKVNNIIYEVKEINDDFSFYVKKVIYDEENVLLPESEVSNQGKGYYDNYISYVIAKKIESSLIDIYKPVLGENISVKVYEGIGIYDNTVDNLYQYLDNSNKDITDKNISIKDYIDTIDNNSINILINLGEDITADNFKDVVALIKTLDSSTTENVSIEKMIFEFNDDRYIEFDRNFDIIKLKVGKNKYFNDSKDSEMLYDKSICVGNGISTNCIFYDDFVNIDPTTFNF